MSDFLNSQVFDVLLSINRNLEKMAVGIEYLAQAAPTVAPRFQRAYDHELRNDGLLANYIKSNPKGEKNGEDQEGC